MAYLRRRLGGWTYPTIFAAIVHLILLFAPVELRARREDPKKPLTVQLKFQPPPKPVAPPPPPVAKPPPPKKKPKPVKKKPKPVKKKALPAPKPPPPPEPVKETPPPPPEPVKEVVQQPVEPPKPTPPPAPKAKPAPMINMAGFRRSIFREIVAEKNYPRSARRMRMQGKCLLLVRINKSGQLAGSPRVLRSTGHSVLDEEAIRSIKAAAPFAVPAGRFPKDQLEFKIPIQFKLTS